jgi:hypothetical protein
MIGIVPITIKFRKVQVFLAIGKVQRIGTVYGRWPLYSQLISVDGE